MVARSVTRQRLRALAEVLDELADDLRLAQHFGDGEHEVGRRARRMQLALEVHADDVRREEVHRLAEHAGLGLDAAHAPADHADAVDHGGVAVGADQRVGIADAVARLVHAAARGTRGSPGGTMPMPGGTTLKVSNACMPHFMNW